MLKAGIMLCPHCGTVDRNAVYMNREEKIYGALIRHPRGYYYLQGMKPEREPLDDNDTDIPLAMEFGTIYPLDGYTPKPEERGLPDIIDLKLGTRIVKMYRCCRHCQERLSLHAKGLGRVPTIFIAMVGASDSGKTSWLSAISYLVNLLPLREQVKKTGFDIRPHRTVKRVEQIGSTQMVSDGSSNFLDILWNGTVVATLYFIDLAGEHFKNLPNKYERLLLGDGVKDYKGVDAAVFIEPLGHELDPNKMGAEEVFNTLHDAGKLNELPVAYVRNKLDILLGDTAVTTTARYKVCDLEGFVETREVDIPLISADTFPVRSEVRYDRVSLESRLRLQHSIARDPSILSNVFAGLTGDNCKGFLVQSCKHILEGNVDCNDYSFQMNVLDPLVWLLLRLKLMPWDALKGDSE